MNVARMLPLFVLAPALAVAACQQAKQSSKEANPEGKPGFSLSGGTLVLPAVKGNPGAAYFDLTNSSEKAAALAAVSIEGAGKAEMHETRGGTMVPLKSLEVGPGETVKFERGGKHVMAFDLADSLAPGGTTEMTLTFSDGDKLSAPLKVEAAGGGALGGMGGDMGGMH